jgi:hypothetical protein
MVSNSEFLLVQKRPKPCFQRRVKLLLTEGQNVEIRPRTQADKLSPVRTREHQCLKLSVERWHYVRWVANALLRSDSYLGARYRRSHRT